MITQLSVTPRRPGDPQVDNTAVLLIHRAVLVDAARFTVLLTDLAQAGTPIEPRRATAIRDYLVMLGIELHEHHSCEDDVAWPMIAASAGAVADLAPLTQEHTALASLIDMVMRVADAFAADPAAHVQCLAVSLQELSGLLHEHIPGEERHVFPIISHYVSVPDWETAEREMLAGLSLRHLAWLWPWMERFAGPEELEYVLARSGLVSRLLLALTRGGYRRREQLIFGPDALR
ncbi:MAG: hemerythrin domain-containing protein [Pseudonocardiaceae bacterium]